MRMSRRSSPRSRTVSAIDPALMTSDEYAAYETVIATTFSEVVLERPTGPGRRPLLPEREPAPGLTYATVHKERREDRVVAIHREVVLGDRRRWTGR